MKLAGLGVVSLLLQLLHFHTKSRIRDSGFVLLRHVQHVMLLEPSASVPLTQGLELRPVCDELLRETPLRGDGARHSRLLVLGTGRHRKSILPLIVCLMETVELRQDEGATPVSWTRAGGGGCGAPAFATPLQPAPDGCAGWFATGCSVQS